MKFRNLILGGGVTAGYAAREYVERGGKPGELAIVSAEDRAPYDRPPLSKDVLQGEMEADEATIGDAALWEDSAVELLLRTRVVSADLPGRRLETAAGDALEFENLLIATGSRVRRFDGPARDLANLFYLRTVSDVDRILAAAEPDSRAVVVGGSFIGTEVAASLRQRGLDVTIVLREDRLLEDRPHAPEMSAHYARVFRDRGVEIHAGEAVEGFAGQTRVSGVALASGRRLPADLVVAGIGVEPQTELFEESDIETDDGIVVDERLRTGVPGVRAAGDVARWPDPFSGRSRRVEHWDNAKAQGRYWARVITGGEDEPFAHLPYFFSDAFDLSWEYWGDRSVADEIVYRGEVDSGSYSAWWLADRRVVAAFVMDRSDEEREAAQRWIEEGHRADRDALADEGSDLL